MAIPQKKSRLIKDLAQLEAQEDFKLRNTDNILNDPIMIGKIFKPFLINLLEFDAPIGSLFYPSKLSLSLAFPAR